MPNIWKLWSITSFEDYQNNWISIANKFEKLTTYQIKMGYKSPEDFFNKNAFAAQDLANDRVGNILERVFFTTDLPENVRQQLKRFTYRAIDFLRMNDLEVVQITRQNQSSYNNGRSDITQVSQGITLESMVGQSALRAWTNANIEKLYFSYLKENDIPYLLDPTKFYNKNEVDYLLSLLDQDIELEHNFTEVEIGKVQNDLNSKYDEINNNLSLKQNISDQKLFQQESDQEGNPTGDIELVGEYDELMVVSKGSSSYIYTTSENKKRGVININKDYGQVVDAETYQTSSEIDAVNPIGRIWGKGIENIIDKDISDLLELKTKFEELIKDIQNPNNQYILGEYKWVAIGTVISKGWIKVPIIKGLTLVAGMSNGISEGQVKSHYHMLKWRKSTPANSVMHFAPGATNQYDLWDSPSENPYDFYGNTEKNSDETYNLAAGIFAELWQFVGVDENCNTNTVRDVNFTLPYYERLEIEKKEFEKSQKEANEVVKKKDIEPLKKSINQISEVTEDLKLKDEYRMKKLGMNPNHKYYKEGDKTDEK